MFTPHPSMSFARDCRTDAEGLGPFLYLESCVAKVGLRARLRSRVAFVLLSKLYRQMYAATGISADSARRKKSKTWARWTGRHCK